MAINRNDDYEKLAKLLYPSIEASGNTYYGQTRRLTLDEVFNKNNGGFESHIESVRVDNPSADYGFTYDTLFCWKVGPLSGTLKVDAEYNIGTYFAIYEIVSEPVTNVNQLNSGEFNTYEYNTSCEFKEIKETDGKSPVNITEVYDGRNFYIYKDGIKNYIAVAVIDEVEVPYDENNPLKLTAVNGEVTIELQCVGTVQDWPKAVRQESYECKSPASQDQWVNFTLGTDSVVLQPGESAYFRIKYGAAKPFSINKYINFVFTTGNGGKIQANGDIRSMQFDKTEMSPYEFINLFKECDLLIKAPDLYAYTASNYCYNNMFANCTALKSPPRLELRTVAESCCGYMFYACSLLKSTPIIKVVDFSNSESCFEWMFQECSSLKNVTCYNIANGDDQTVGWLNNISLSGIFKTLSDTQWELDSDSGIPENWIRVNIEVEPTNYETDKKLTDVLITSGSNSAENGRGDITTSDTLSNMENSFDENGTHQMNIYNADRSFNQEIWGYKCFNSPVQFNNGIYGEQAKLVTTCEVKDNILDSYSEHIENIGSKLSSYTNANNISSNVTVLNTHTTVSNDDDLVVRNELGTCTSLVAGSVDYINIFNNSVNGTIIAASYNNIKKYDSDYDEYYYSEESDIILKAKSNSSYYSTIRINSSEEQEPENLIHETYIKLESNDINNGNKSYINIKPNNIYLHSSCLNIGDYNDSFKINIENYNIQTKCNILPNFNEIYNLGSDTKKWENIYCKYIHADNVADVERTVTTHKNGDNTSGDDQTIRGVKTFMDGITVNDIVTAVGNVNIMHTGDAQIGSLKFDGLYFTDLYNATQNNPPLSCFKSSVTSVGTNPHQSVAIIAGNTGNYSNAGIHLRYQSNSLDDPDNTNVRICIGNDDLLIAGYYSEFLNNGCYIPRLKTDGLVISKDNGIVDFRDGSSIRFWPDSNTQIPDSPGNLYRSTKTNAEADGKLKLSKMDGTQDQIYIAEAATHAKVNTSDSSKADCPVGSIVYAILAKDIDNSIVTIGTPFTINANQAVVAILTDSGYSFTIGSAKLPAGKYKAFSDINFTGISGWFNDPVLIQRVADDV